ncbi:hypothetical protein DV872_16965 [Oceanispirochaeta sp. M1]|nr:hypothetical protein DV872_16965 [Oceanispirochaeta sp. M1]
MIEPFSFGHKNALFFDIQSLVDYYFYISKHLNEKNESAYLIIFYLHNFSGIFYNFSIRIFFDFLMHSLFYIIGMIFRDDVSNLFIKKLSDNDRELFL